MKNIYILILAGILVFSHKPLFSQDDNFNALENFFNAGSAYKKGDYETAAILYEEILQNGLASGELYYNLGNTYFKRGVLGKTVLNYERARRYIPRDSDLESNYLYALSMVKGAPADTKKSIVHRIIHRFIDRFTADELAIITLLLLLLGGIVYLSRLFFHWSSKVPVFTVIILCVLAAFHLFLLLDKVHYEDNLGVVVTNTDSKFEPIEGATTYFELPEGSRIRLLDVKDDWVKIKRPDGKTGWSRKDKIKLIKQLHHTERGFD